MTKSIAAAGLKITPDVQVSGDGGGSSSVFNAFIAQLLASNRTAASNGGADSTTPASAQ